MGGGIEDQTAGAFTVGQAACLQPLQNGSAATVPSVVAGSAVVYPNSSPDTDTVVRPTAFGSAIVEHLRGAAAPTDFSWAISLESGEELVELEDGGIAVIVPGEDAIEGEEVPTAPTGGPKALNDTDIQVAQAEHDLAAANQEVEGEVKMVIAAPEVVTASGEVLPGILRITGARVVTAELPPNAVAETEAMIIRLSPPAEPESICASVLARAPQYAARVCGEEELEPDEEDAGDPLGLWDTAHTPNAGLNAEMSDALKEFERVSYRPGATASSGSSAKESGQQKRFCENHALPFECAEFTFDGFQAAVAENNLFNIPSDGTQANAFRHTFWVALMREDNPNVNHHWYDGIVWAIDHEEDEWKSHNQARRNGSRMDYLNDWVGWDRAGASEHQSCEIMLKKAALDSIFIGSKRDPFAWANNHGYEYFHPVFRKLRDNIGPDSSGLPVYATGTRCSEIGF